MTDNKNYTSASIGTVGSEQSEILQSQSLLQNIEKAFSKIKNSVAFSLNEETVTFEHNNKTVEFTADELVKFTSDLKPPMSFDKIGIDEDFIKMSVGNLFQNIQLPEDSNSYDEANLYNITRSYNLGVMPTDPEYYASKLILPQEEDDFRGNYLRCLVNVHTNTDNYRVKKATKSNIVKHVNFQINEFDDAFKFIKEPPIDLDRLEKIDMLEWANIKLKRNEQLEPKVERAKRLQIIDYLVNDENAPFDDGGKLRGSLVEQHAASLNNLFLDSSLTSEDGHSSLNKNRQEVSDKQKAYFNEVKDAMLVTQSYNFLQGPFAEQLLENSSKFQDKTLRRAAREFIQQCDPESFSAFIAKRQQDSFQEKFSTFMENTESVIEKISAPLANTYLGDALGIDRTKPKMKLSR